MRLGREVSEGSESCVEEEAEPCMRRDPPRQWGGRIQLEDVRLAAVPRAGADADEDAVRQPLVLSYWHMNGRVRAEVHGSGREEPPDSAAGLVHHAPPWFYSWLATSRRLKLSLDLGCRGGFEFESPAGR